MIKLGCILKELTGEETTREQFVLAVSRDIVNAFKSGERQYTDYFTMSRAGEEAEVNLDVKFYKRPKQDIAFSIAAGFGPNRKGDNDYLEINVEYNPKQFPQAMAAFVTEIKETIEHEFEHVGQQNFEDMYIVSNRYDEPLAYPEDAPQAPNHFLYLISNTEIPAYVKGLLKRAKVNKITFDQALEDYYNDYKATFDLYGTSWPTVKKIWKDWALVNKNRLKKFA